MSELEHDEPEGGCLWVLIYLALAVAAFCTGMAWIVLHLLGKT